MARLRDSPIAILLPSVAGGGAERISLNLADGMASRGLAVDLVLVQLTGPYIPHIPPDVRVVDLAARRHLTSLLPLVRYLQRARPRVLLSALTHTNLYALAARRLARSPIRVVVRINNTLTEEYKVAQGVVARVIRPAVTRRLYPEADAIVAVSQGAANGLLGAVGPLRVPLHVIPNPVVHPLLFRQAAQPLDHPWFRPGAEPVLLAVGRLEPQKDFATLIRAFALVRRKTAARLLILGEGSERKRLQAVITACGLEQTVQMPGFVSNPYPYLAAARGVVLSSRYEGAPSVLVEALALGTPVASTDCPSGPREILEGGRWGRLTSVGDAAGLAASMDDLLGGSPLPAPGPDHLDRYGLDHAVDSYLSVLGVGTPVPTRSA